MPIGSYSFGFLCYMALDNMPVESYSVGFLYYMASDSMSTGSYSFGFSLLHSIRTDLSCQYYDDGLKGELSEKIKPQ